MTMTLEELRLRIEAAFPGATVGRQPLDEAGVEFAFDIEGVGLAGLCRCGECLSSGRAFAASDDWVEQRIRDVSAHDMIAARRRLALEELARLDADLIMSEPPADAD